MEWPRTPWSPEKESLTPAARIEVQEWMVRRDRQLRTFGTPERRRPMMLARLPPVQRDQGVKRWPQPWRRRNAPGVER